MNKEILLKHINEHVRKITKQKVYLSNTDLSTLDKIEDLLDSISVVGIK
jgi:hypothetical protein